MIDVKISSFLKSFYNQRMENGKKFQNSILFGSSAGEKYTRIGLVPNLEGDY